MPRSTLGKGRPAGESRRLEVKYTEEEREAIESVLRIGETMSAFTREAWDYLVDKRLKDARKKASGE